MRAAALNYRDLLVPQRGYGSRMQELPLIMLSDGVGVADAIGEGVTAVREGDRLCPLFFQSWIAGKPNENRLSLSLGVEMDGTMAEFMVLSEAGVAAAPSRLSDGKPLQFHRRGNRMASAGDGRPAEGRRYGFGARDRRVSLFALQFAKLLGAFVIVTSSSDSKLERARGLGADEAINYRTTPGWGKRAREITAGNGVDHIIEVGGQGTLPESLRAVRPGGTISMIGVLAGGMMDARLGLVVTRHVRLQDHRRQPRRLRGDGAR